MKRLNKQCTSKDNKQRRKGIRHRATKQGEETISPSRNTACMSDQMHGPGSSRPTPVLHGQIPAGAPANRRYRAVHPRNSSITTRRGQQQAGSRPKAWPGARPIADDSSQTYATGATGESVGRCSSRPSPQLHDIRPTAAPAGPPQSLRLQPASRRDSPMLADAETTALRRFGRIYRVAHDEKTHDRCALCWINFSPKETSRVHTPTYARTRTKTPKTVLWDA